MDWLIFVAAGMILKEPEIGDCVSIEPLIRKLVALPVETEWVELKHNNSDPKEIGEYISALSNTATLRGKDKAYVVWGVDDETHDLLGTKFDPARAKANNTEIDTWLRKRLSDYAGFRFFSENIEGKRIVLLEIDPAQVVTVQFEHNAWLRVGTYKKRLKDFPALEAELWKKLNNADFEVQPAKSDLTMQEAFKLLDYVSYFDLLGIEQPESQSQMLHYLLEDELISKQDDGRYSITNLGALLFAKKLSTFNRVWRKALRIIQYKGAGRTEGVREEVMDRGYISGFEEFIRIIESILPSREELVNGARQVTITAFPDTGIRELVANQLEHQDLAETGSGPMVEIFDGRIEFTNPGAPLVDTNRFIDGPPKTRNEKIAALFRRANISEERGSGWDKIEMSCGDYCLPAPSITEYPYATRVTMAAHKPYKDMSNEERLWTCYVHACLQKTRSEKLTNATLRERLGISEENKAIASRLIRSAVAKGLIKPFDATAAPRYMGYVPFWA
jgi:predicted HTH transcriptional regulator